MNRSLGGGPMNRSRRRWTSSRSVLVAMCTLVVVSACRPPDQRTDSVDPAAAAQERASWPASLVAQIDSGNAAVRADSYDEARRHFTTATELAPDVAAAWFGLYLAEQGLGNSGQAADALERAQALQAGASLIHHEREDPPS